MSSATVAVQQSKQGLIARSWIIDKRNDLIWFIGSVVVSYLFLAGNLLLVSLGLPVMILVWVWALGFDGPHVFGTVSRTYADNQERRARARLFYGSLSLFLLGPIDAALRPGDGPDRCSAPHSFSSPRCGLITIWSSSTTAS